ncbi:hypothetical protein KPL71_026449 [Citrus sinensis]|uniref:Uncharacterized protein n=1 Tax=Citrus sinensis TaxID=2711 RepID=A0ACB8HZC8_CITSI|nr:hypothetical protein KPL71_026449 [Citrus sinensis]
MAYEWKTFPHHFPLNHDPTIISTLNAYLLELNNIQPVPTDIHHTSIGPSHTLEIIPGTHICTPGSNSSPHGILVRTIGILVGNQNLRTAGPKDSLALSWFRCNNATYLYLTQWRRENFSFMASTSSSPPVTLSSTLSLPRSYTSHTTNKIENLVEYSYIPESAQIISAPSSLPDVLTLKNISSLPAWISVLFKPPLPSNRKGLPVTARLAMLDTRFKQYQDAVIGTVLTTLHAGSVLLTFYPNFNLSLQDPNLPTTLKVQVQIQAESDQIPTIIQIPRQIPRHELIKLMPLEWISNYEQFHNNTAPIQTFESMFERRQDGTVRMTFKQPPSAPQEPPRLSFTYSSMITAVQTGQEDLPITGFNSEGYPVYPAKHNGYFLWDAPGSGMCDPTCPCWDDWEEDDDYVPRRKKKPKKKKPPISCHHYDPKPPQDPPPPPAPLPFSQKELKWIAKHCKSETPSPIPLPTPPLTCMMFSSTSLDYSSSFPPLEPHTDSQRNVVSKPFIPSPITSTGHLEPPKPFESVLNWQTQNARAQNDTLLQLNSKVEKISFRTDQIETKVDSITAQMQQIHQNLQSRIGQLDSELRAMLAHRYNGLEFDQKEREIRDNPLPPPPKPKPKSKPQPRPVTFHQSSDSTPAPASASVPPPTISQPPTQSKDKEPMHLFTAHTITHSSTTNDQTSDSNLAVSDSHTETDTESSASTSDSEKSYADITKILMAQPNQPTQGQTSHTEPYVDIPSEVEEEMPESSATNQPSPTQAPTNPSSQDWKNLSINHAMP